MTDAKKRLIAGIGGLLYAVIYGFWTLFVTGGGHVNFVWIWLFIAVGFVGLYFPIMAVLAVNLSSFFAKLIFGSLVAFNLVASTIIILGWINDPGGERPSDFSRTVQSNGVETVLLCAFAHFLPTAIFAFLLIRSITTGKTVEKEEMPVSLNLS